MQLEPASPDRDVPLLIQAADVPLVIGTARDARDILCPACHGSVLLSSMPDESVYDVAFKCFRCEAVVLSPSLPSGCGVGGAVHVLRPGQHAIYASLVVDCDHIVIGAPGMQRRAAETGSIRDPQPRFLLDVPGIASVLVRARDAFGPLVEAAEQRFARTPKRHRLVHLIKSVEENLAAIKTGSQEVDVVSAIELWRLANQFHRWRLDPSYERLLTESIEPTAFSHNAVLLTIASRFADGGLGVELVSPMACSVDDGRTPDLRVRMSARRWIEADVKAPATLQRQQDVELTDKPALKIIEDAVRSSRGQFSTAALLVIGGALWDDGRFDEHETAVERVLSKPLRTGASPEARHHHHVLLGVILVSTTIELARTRGTGDFKGNWNEVDWTPDVQFRWVANPHYRLDFDLSFAADMSSFEANFPL